EVAARSLQHQADDGVFEIVDAGIDDRHLAQPPGAPLRCPACRGFPDQQAEGGRKHEVERLHDPEVTPDRRADGLQIGARLGRGIGHDLRVEAAQAPDSSASHGAGERHRGKEDRRREGQCTEPRVGHRFARAIGAPRLVIRLSNAGKDVAIGEPSSTLTGRFAASPRMRKDMAMRWSRWVLTVAPPATPPGPMPWTVSTSSCSSTRTPQASSPRAIASIRSLSLTRSSLTPRITVRPSAKEATAARIGYSSIIEAARASGTLIPLSAEARTLRSATGS